jgi:hypothetical protein
MFAGADATHQSWPGVKMPSVLPISKRRLSILRYTSVLKKLCAIQDLYLTLKTRSTDGTNDYFLSTHIDALPSGLGILTVLQLIYKEAYQVFTRRHTPDMRLSSGEFLNDARLVSVVTNFT